MADADADADAELIALRSLAKMGPGLPGDFELRKRLVQEGLARFVAPELGVVIEPEERRIEITRKGHKLLARSAPAREEVQLDDGTWVLCRFDGSMRWVIYAPIDKNPKRGSGNVVGTEGATPEEVSRWSATVGAGRPEGHTDGWLASNGAYRNEADEAAALVRWRIRADEAAALARWHVRAEKER